MTLWNRLSQILLLTYLFVVFRTFQDYGITWDEYLHVDYGNLVIQWYQSFFKNDSFLHYKNLHLYGALFDLPAQLFSRILPFGVYESRHLLAGLLNAYSGYAVFKIANRISGERAGFLAVLFLFLTPVYFGHAFNNPKDLPFATLFALGLSQIISLLDELPIFTFKRIFSLSLCIGLAIGMRVGGVILFAYLGVACIFYALTTLTQPYTLTYRAKSLAPLALKALLVFPLAWIVMLPYWPWAQLSPILHPHAAMRHMQNNFFQGSVFFNGQAIDVNHIPWWYLPLGFSVTLSDFYFLCFGLGIFSFFVSLKAKLISERKSLLISFLIFSVLFPWLYAVKAGSTMYDGIRHFLFLSPAIAVLAALSFDSFLNVSRGFFKKAAASVFLAVLLFQTYSEMTVLHPYQSTFYNSWVAGGLKKASLKFETDYWGAAHKEGVEYLLTQAPLILTFQKKLPVLVGTCNIPDQAQHYFDRSAYAGKFKVINANDDPSFEYLLASTRNDCKRLASQTLFTVSRESTPLLYVMKK